MLKFFVLCAFFAASISAEFVRRDVTFDTSLSTEEAAARVSGRLGGGSQVGDTDLPFVVDIMTFWADASWGICTGSIIASSVILTSRNCLFDDNLRMKPTNVLVEVGAATRNVPRFHSLISNAVWLDRQGMPQGPHPNFAIANLTVFLAMTPTVQVIRLPSYSQSTHAFTNTEVDIAGWAIGSNLHRGDLIISPIWEGTVIGLTEYEFTAFPSALTLENGNHGGPMFIRDPQGPTLIGTLWTQRFSTIHSANVITAMQIGQFWDFIHDVTGIPRRWG